MTPTPDCAVEGCDRDASYYRYTPKENGWLPVCTVDARTCHPSLEIHAWLESGYLKPAELGRPCGPPDIPTAGRSIAFQRIVEEAMGWNQ